MSSKLSDLRNQATSMINSLEPDMTKFETAIEQAIKDKKLTVIVERGTLKERELLSKYFIVSDNQGGTKWEISFEPKYKIPPNRESSRWAGGRDETRGRNIFLPD